VRQEIGVTLSEKIINNMRSEITIIVFSKNRACQLELLLRSLQQFQYNSPVSVLYTCNPGFEAGYKKLIEMYPEITFIREVNFKQQLVCLIGEYTMFMVDDDIIIESFCEDCPEFIEFKRNPDILCLTLRIWPGYNAPPELKNNTWIWRGLKKGWGYPMSVTSHIFRKEDIFPIILKNEMEIPNDLEVRLRKNAPDRPLMLCFDKPKTINNLANQVQNKYVSKNLSGVSLEYLEEMFLKGERLSLEDIKEKAKGATDCFLKTDFKWEKIKN
jgi:hypothetical protein